MSLLLALSPYTTANAADVAPPTNVNCSIILTGARCSASIISTGSSLAYALAKNEWYVSILKPGAPQTDVASYGPPIFVKSTESGVGIGTGVSIGAGVLIGTGSIDFSYETLLGFTNNDPQGTVLISARTFNSANEATPFFGQRNYLALTEVKALMAVEGKVIADKAAAELSAKLAADKAAADKAAADKAAADKAAEQKTIAELTALVKSIAAKVKGSQNGKTTITCVKGKLTKKVTAVKPKCPTGYKVKK